MKRTLDRPDSMSISPAITNPDRARAQQGTFILPRPARLPRQTFGVGLLARLLSALLALSACFASHVRAAQNMALVQNVGSCTGTVWLSTCSGRVSLNLAPGEVRQVSVLNLCWFYQHPNNYVAFLNFYGSQYGDDLLAGYVIVRWNGNPYDDGGFKVFPVNGCLHHYFPADDLHEMPPKLDRDPCGMPVWQVSEPYISLWLRDEPLSYQPSMGRSIAFELNFKHREYTAGLFTNLFGVGKKWSCPWLGYVTWGIEVAPGGASHDLYTVHFPGGGERTFDGQHAYDYLTNTRLDAATDGFTVSYPDGSSDFYGLIVSNNFNVNVCVLLTERSSPQSHKTRFNYFDYTPSDAPVIRLKSVVDCDGGTNWIYYDSTNAYSTNLISQVVDPFGRSTSLLYDSQSRLTSITDVAGMTSSFVYDDHDWITNMITPYGTNSFSITENNGAGEPPNGRSILVTEPDGSHQLFLYKDSAPGVTNAYGAEEVPTNVFTSTFDNSQLDLRNSFHWGRRQYEALSTTAPGSFTAADFRKARLRHWLKVNTNTLAGLLYLTNTVSMTVSLGRAPSPDSAGAIEGQTTWYDYVGKPNSAFEGTQAMPLFVAQVLPDGTSRFTRTERNLLGLTTNEISTCSVPPGVALRTNTSRYATNNIDLLRVTNALGVQISSNFYNGYHQVLTNYNGLGEMTVFTYNGQHQVAAVSRPSGLITTNLYFTTGQTSNRLDKTIDYAIVGGSTVYYRTNAFTWADGLVATHTDPRGLTLTFTWDELQRLRRVDHPDGTFVTNSYDKLDLVRVLDRMGFTNSLGYDAVRRMTAATNANGVVTRYTYCSCGSLESVTNAFGTPVQQVTRYYYDNQGNRIQTIGPDNYTVNYNYNSLGQVTNVADAVTSVTNWYNNQGLLIASFNPFGQVSAAIYDILDRATNTTDANGVTITNTFDSLDRLLTKGYPDAGVERFAYTPNIAAPTGYTNQLGTNVVNYIYDPLGRKTAELFPGLRTNSFAYAPAGDLLTLTDGKNQVTTWNYDEYGRATNKLDATSAEIFHWTFDPNGRMTNRWTPEKGDTSYAYDRLGNLTNIGYSASALGYSYDALGRLTNMVDAAGTTKYTHTTAGLLETEDGPWDDDTVTYMYQNRLRTGLGLAQPNASPWTQSYGYDGAKRMTSLASGAGAFTYAYDPVRHLQVGNLTLPGGAYITNAYDSVARLLSTVLKNSAGTALDSSAYTYNQANQRTYVTRTEGSFVGYTYDNMGQLKTALGNEPGGTTNRLHEQCGYAYDAAGNLNWRTNNALLQQFQANDLNELTTVSRTVESTLTVAGTTTSPAANVTVNSSNAVLYSDSTFAKDGFALADGTNTFTAIAQDAYGRRDTNTSTCYLPSSTSFTYDANGNLTNDGRRSFSYDDENQLVSVVVTNGPGDSKRSDFVYDGRMRRRIRREYIWQSGIWNLQSEIRYVYDGSLAIQERDANNLPLVTYARGLDLSGSLQGAGGIGGLLARSQASAATAQAAYYHADGNGNIPCLINTNQVVVAKYLYDPYGGLVAMSGPLAEANLYRFSSKEYHLGSGLIYYGRRFYDPRLQRWPNPDPILELGGINLYAYVSNDPINGMDAFGLLPDPDCMGRCFKENLADAALVSRMLGALSVGALGNIPYQGRPIAWRLGIVGLYRAVAGLRIATLGDFMAAGASASAASAAAAIVGAGLAGYATGTYIYCRSQCPEAKHCAEVGRPVTYRNSVPSMIIRAPAQ